MLRTFFISLSKADWARQSIMNWDFAWKMAQRFIAGETLADAIQAVRTLNEKGIDATLDHLGENTHTASAARQATRDILDIFAAIEKSGVASNVSIKLTQIGMHVDEALCQENLLQITEAAKRTGAFVRIDMEDSDVTGKTLELFELARSQYGSDTVGIVIQSYLYRSESDIQKLNQVGGRVRLCKGAYQEPPTVAYPKKSDVDANYDRITRLLFEAAKESGVCGSEDGRIPPIPALATHDEKRIQYACWLAEQIGLPKECFEFQMLYGIRRELQENLVKDGYKVRVYVPYGTQWYPYYMRRLAERPANVWFMASNFFRN